MMIRDSPCSPNQNDPHFSPSLILTKLSKCQADPFNFHFFPLSIEEMSSKQKSKLNPDKEGILLNWTLASRNFVVTGGSNSIGLAIVKVREAVIDSEFEGFLDY
jgi:hypothetical protein